MKRLFAFPFILLFALLAAVALTATVMLLWNLILVPVMHLATIQLWQAAGILLLARILFGARGGRHFGRHVHMKRVFGKWQRLSDDEKAMFKEKMEHCHYHAH